MPIKVDPKRPYLYQYAEVADMLGITRVSLRRLISNGRLEAIGKGLIAPAALDRYMATRRRPGRPRRRGKAA